MKTLSIILKKIGLPLVLWLMCCLTITLPVHAYFAFFLCLLIMAMMINNHNLWDYIASLLLIFGITYSFIITVYYRESGVIPPVRFALEPVTLYLLGKYFVKKLCSDRLIVILLFFTCIACAVVISYYTISDYANGISINVERTFQNDELELSATIYGLIGSIYLVGLGFFLIYYKTYNKFISIGFLILFILGFVSVIHLLSRTGIVVSIITTLAMLSTMKVRRVIRSFILLLITVIIVSYLINPDFLYDIVTEYSNRNQGSGSIESGSSRFYRWGDAINKLLDYPIGWWQNSHTYNAYVHNRWLDIARVVGLIPFILSLIFLGYTIKNQIQLFKYVRKSAAVLLTFGMLLSISVASFVEPVMEANITYFCLLDFMVGIETQMYNNRRTLFKANSMRKQKSSLPTSSY